MLFVDNQDVRDPKLNLALEEYLLREVAIDTPLLLFYINEPSVIMGRNQNSLEEVDPAYIEKEGIHLVRRLSGGGAVFHDLGNLNFSFITPDRKDLHNFARFIDPVVSVLQSLGLDAKIHGKSDIFVAGKKVSGNAQYASNGRLFSHGTLLFDTNLNTMLNALNPKKMQITSNAVQSIRNYVTNIREHLPKPMTIEQFGQTLLQGIFEQEQVPTYDIDRNAWQEILKISANRYTSWGWNIGHAPPFNVQKEHRFAVGKLDARIQVEKGKIQAISFFGDFFGQQDVTQLEKQLIGTQYEPLALKMTLQEINITDYFGEIEKDAFLDFLY